MLNRRSPARRYASRKGKVLRLAEGVTRSRIMGRHELAEVVEPLQPCAVKIGVDDCSYPLALRFYTAKRLFFIDFASFASVFYRFASFCVSTKIGNNHYYYYFCRYIWSDWD